MEQYHPLLNVFIFKKLAEKGLSNKELCQRTGYTNLSKGCKKLDIFRTTGKIEDTLLLKIIAILQIPQEELNRALFDERIYIENECFNAWIASVKMPSPETTLCNHCVFRSVYAPLICSHPFCATDDPSLKIAKWVGYPRPDWCPMRE